MEEGIGLVEISLFDFIESIEAAKLTEKDESVKAVFNVAVNILSRDSQAEQENE